MYARSKALATANGEGQQGRRQISKPAAEFKDELDALGVRVDALTNG